jgi:hypothetical protein
MKKLLSIILLGSLVFACKQEGILDVISDPQIYQFKEISSIALGGVGASEISAYDPTTKKLFVVNNSKVNKIDVLDYSNPASPKLIKEIAIAT